MAGSVHKESEFIVEQTSMLLKNSHIHNCSRHGTQQTDQWTLRLCRAKMFHIVSHPRKPFAMFFDHLNQLCNIVSRFRFIKRFQWTINVCKYREGQLCCLKLSCRWINNNQILIMACRWCQQCIKSKFLSSSSRTFLRGVSRSSGHGKKFFQIYSSINENSI